MKIFLAILTLPALTLLIPDLPKEDSRSQRINEFYDGLMKP